MPIFQPKTKPDPVAALPWVDISMRWALMVTEVQLGRTRMGAFLRQIGLSQYIDHYPEDNTLMSGNVTMGQYSAFMTGLMQQFGEEGRKVIGEIGRVSIENATYVFSAQTLGEAATSALFQAPAVVRAHSGLEAMRLMFERTYRANSLPPLDISIEQQANKHYYHVTQCPCCAGWQSDGPICEMISAYLQAGVEALFPGQQVQVREIACRAAGAPRCSWEISIT